MEIRIPLVKIRKSPVQVEPASYTPLEPSALPKNHSVALHAPTAHVRAAVHTRRLRRPLADRIGIWLSFICVIHCLATPVLLLAFPALEAMKITRLHESFHLALLLILPIVAVIAFIPGYLKHQNRQVFYWAIPGLIIIAFVALWFDEASWLATAVSVTGSLFLIRAHMINRRLCVCCLPPR